MTPSTDLLRAALDELRLCRRPPRLIVAVASPAEIDAATAAAREIGGAHLRAPHCTASVDALIGRDGLGEAPRHHLGEVRLAWGGLLYLDELQRFPWSAIEAIGAALRGIPHPPAVLASAWVPEREDHPDYLRGWAAVSRGQRKLGAEVLDLRDGGTYLV